jgi:hypothetical protein
VNEFTTAICWRDAYDLHRQRKLGWLSLSWTIRWAFAAAATSKVFFDNA